MSAGVIIVRRYDDEWRYLLLRVYNYWDFPKGEVEPGEDPLAAARYSWERDVCSARTASSSSTSDQCW